MKFVWTGSELDLGSGLGWALVLTLGLVGCKEKPAWKEIDYERRGVTREAIETELPSALWDKLAEVGGSAQQVEKRPTEFVSLKAYIYEKSPGATLVPALELDFGGGGGSIDFAEFLAPRNGSFYLAVALEDELKDEPFKAYFLSNAPEFEVGHRRHGGGCAAFYDVSSFFKKSMRSAGILLNSFEGSSAFASAGSLYFAYLKDNKLRLSQLALRDSRYPAAQCRLRHKQ